MPRIVSKHLIIVMYQVPNKCPFGRNLMNSRPCVTNIPPILDNNDYKFYHLTNGYS